MWSWSYTRDKEGNEIYRINRNTLLIRSDNWELWKGNNKDGWWKIEDVKRKDYASYIKASNSELEKEIIEIDRTDYFIKSSEADKLVEKIHRERKEQQEQEARERQARETLANKIREVTREIREIDESKMTLEEIEVYTAYMDTIISNIKNNEIKDTKTTREVNKNRKLELYKNAIHNYVKQGKYISMNQLCKDLKINRRTFYNHKLNEYLEDVISEG